MVSDDYVLRHGESFAVLENKQMEPDKFPAGWFLPCIRRQNAENEKNDFPDRVCISHNAERMRREN